MFIAPLIIGKGKQGGSSTPPPIPDDGYIVIWAIGDSHMQKRNPTGTSYGPTPTAGTVYQWDVANNNLYEISNTDIKQSGSGANWGSIYPQMGISINAATGKKVVFVTCGVGGTNYAPRTGDSGNWDPNTGGLYGPAKATLDNCLVYMGRTQPNYMLTSLGGNDHRGTTSMDTIYAAITALNDKVHADYPSAGILQVMSGRDNLVLNSARASLFRKYIKQEVVNRSYMYLAGSETALGSAGYYDSADDIHLTQAGNNEIGKMVGRWFANSSYSKWARAIIASHFDDLSTSRKNKIEQWITDIGSNYFVREFFYRFKTTTINNIYFDYTFTLCGQNNGATFTANDCITTNGSSQYYRTGFVKNRAVYGAVDDFYVSVKVKTNRNAAGSGVRTAMGASEASNVGHITIGQTNTNVTYRASDATASTTAETSIQNDSWYSVYRLLTTKGLWKNSASVATAVVAHTVNGSNNVYVGANDNNGTANEFMDGDFTSASGGQFSGSNLATVYAADEALDDNWNS